MAETQPVPLPLPEIKPNPDPSLLTTDQIRREAGMVKELIEQRLTSMDKAIVLLQSAVDREPKPPVLEANIEQLRVLYVNLKENIDMRFSERDKRNEHMIRDSKAIVDNTIMSMKDAFTEQNKSSQTAISKSESGIAKQMDQIESKFGTEIKSLDNQLHDLKLRVSSFEAKGVGQKELKDDTGKQTSQIIAFIAVVVSVISVVYAMTKDNPQPQVQFVPSNQIQQSQPLPLERSN